MVGVGGGNHLCYRWFRGSLWSIVKRNSKSSQGNVQTFKKAVDDSGMDRQQFRVTNDGVLHPSTKPLSCFFVFKKKKFRYRKNCSGLIHKDKNRFILNSFDNTIFLLGDVTELLTVSELKQRNQVKLQERSSSSKNVNQNWIHYFERDRSLISTCKADNVLSVKYDPIPDHSGHGVLVIDIFTTWLRIIVKM